MEILLEVEGAEERSLIPSLQNGFVIHACRLKGEGVNSRCSTAQDVDGPPSLERRR